MRVKLVASMLILAVAAFSVAPCAAMGMEMGAGGMGDPCGAGEDRHHGSFDEASCPMPAPQADCCAVSPLPERQGPAERTEVTAPVTASTADASLHHLLASVQPTIPGPDPAPPPQSDVPLQLLLSVFLI